MAGVRFVDANVFVRALTGDDPAEAVACGAIFEAAERGEIDLFTSESVLAEVVFVLSSKSLYGVPRGRLVELLQPLVEARGMRMDRKALILAALDLYAASKLDFEDALSVEHVRRRKLESILSYDRDFTEKFGIVREEP